VLLQMQKHWSDGTQVVIMRSAAVDMDRLAGIRAWRQRADSWHRRPNWSPAARSHRNPTGFALTTTW